MLIRNVITVGLTVHKLSGIQINCLNIFSICFERNASCIESVILALILLSCQNWLRYQDVFAFFFTFFQLLSFIFLCYIFLSLVQTLEARLPGSDLLLVRVISTFETYYVMMENELTFVTLSL